MRRAFAPGRVNLIGDHVDYTGGFVLPMAVQLGTIVHVKKGGDVVCLRSDLEAEPAEVPLQVTDPSVIEPTWARYVAGVVSEMQPSAGADGTVRTTLPVGAGLSSSAALEVAVALVLGFQGSPLELARLCQRAEQRSSGVPCGIMDPLASAAGVAGHALLIDCTSEQVTPVRLPPGVEVVAVHSGDPRRLAGSVYAVRRTACEKAASIIGPLRDASLADLASIEDEVVRRRARHVITENARTLAVAGALEAGDAAAAGRLMVESHASLRDDFEVSTVRLDAVVEQLIATPGVLGARLTGAGFGGCAVALCEAGTRIDVGTARWPLRAVAGAAVQEVPR